MKSPLDKAREELRKWQIIVEYLESTNSKKKITSKKNDILKSAKPNKSKAVRQHWTQTPKGRKRLAEIMKTRWKESSIGE